MTLTPKQITNFYRHFTIGNPDECWEWRGFRGANGYGRQAINRKTVRVHRIAFALANPNVPLPEMVCHSCDNKPCVNPRHLFAGNAAINALDCWRKGRMGGTIKPRLSQEQVATIRELNERGVKNSQIARMMNCTRANIGLIVRNKTWK